MPLQLGLWSCEDTPADADNEIRLTLRESTRARQLILQALPPRTIEVVVPQGMRPGSVQSFIREHRAWIDRAGRHLLKTYAPPDLRPDALLLAATGETVTIHYDNSQAGPARYRYSDRRLSLRGVDPGSEAALSLLRRWLRRMGSDILRPWLEREAARLGLQPSRVQVRLQRTRWGSCSSRGNISLNAALMLVPPELVRYLFVHELCHLRHMSHSRRYWRLVATHEPDYRELDRSLGAHWAKMPAWLFGEGRAR
jgi:predicted metal-dependent hydrolase